MDLLLRKTTGMVLAGILCVLAVVLELGTSGSGVTWAVLSVGVLVFTYGENRSARKDL